MALSTPQALAPLIQLCEVWEGGPFGALITTAGSQLRDSLDTNIQGFELLSDEALSHVPSVNTQLQSCHVII